MITGQSLFLMIFMKIIHSEESTVVPNKNQKGNSSCYDKRNELETAFFFLVNEMNLKLRCATELKK